MGNLAICQHMDSSYRNLIEFKNNFPEYNVESKSSSKKKSKKKEPN